MDINVCIGSACHIKGSYDVINSLKELIALHNLGDKFLLKASFCLGKCSNGVTVKVGETFIDGIFPNTIEQIFTDKILPLV